MANNTAAPAEGKAVDPARQKIARALAKILWERDFKKANPAADAAAKRESWNASKAEYVRAGRSLHMKMEKAGLTVAGPGE
ncbi:MAG TPA: hypothetical protein VGN83_28585 [Falsiroseomonas sp.]|nr:hypothetical protein [Falsiroseomonas sp.]